MPAGGGLYDRKITGATVDDAVRTAGELIAAVRPEELDYQIIKQGGIRASPRPGKPAKRAHTRSQAAP